MFGKIIYQKPMTITLYNQQSLNHKICRKDARIIMRHYTCMKDK